LRRACRILEAEVTARDSATLLFAWVGLDIAYGVLLCLVDGLYAFRLPFVVVVVSEVAITVVTGLFVLWIFTRKG